MNILGGNNIIEHLQRLKLELKVSSCKTFCTICPEESNIMYQTSGQENLIFSKETELNGKTLS